jgi:hypothetical protein
MHRAGKSFEEMCAALRADPETAAWCREKGNLFGGRELRRIWEKAGQLGEIHKPPRTANKRRSATSSSRARQ